MQYRLTHITEYHYGVAATVSHSAVHMLPREVSNQTWQNFDLIITPTPDVFQKHVDFFGNSAAFAAVQQPHKQLIIKLVGTVDVQPRQPLLQNMSRPWEQVRDKLITDLTNDGLDAYQYCFDSPLAPGLQMLQAYTLKSFTPGRPILDAAKDLSERIHVDFKFDPTSTTILTTVQKVFEQRSGVCQDFAHLMIACLRSLDLPARYVSGYLRTYPPPGKPRLIGADASHAWAAVYCPDNGWVDFDPTNSQIVNNDHITLAWGRDFEDVSPVKGVVLGGGNHQIRVSVDVEPLNTSTLAPVVGQNMSQSQSQSQPSTQSQLPSQSQSQNVN
ncbi:MAG TPA: transglutaminase [Phycisphaerales bacterium]|nr:transglutaminase [Phycisphaerales bacterium]HCD31908.1 transglutaminase [Phycisphaerales bacterium]|tara:strand:+ start:23830 stop:24816 length:987 start_codon:yes stop_codon:yes gene_type:complete